MTLAFSLPVDIANVGLAALGVNQITAADFAVPVTKGGREASRQYDKLRVAELRRNCWSFATRRAMLRPIDTGTVIWAPPTYNAAAAYVVGQVSVYNGDWYQAQEGVQVGDIPNTAATWLRYFGPATADPFFLPPGSTSGGGGGYFPGDIVVVPEAYGSGNTYLANTIVDSAGVLYVSLVGANIGHTPATSPTYWAPYVGPSSGSATPSIGPFVYSAFGAGVVVYLSLVSNNQVFPGANSSWCPVYGSVLPLQILYPIGTGPASDFSTPNVFRKPNGFLRQAPTDPKAGISPWVGGPVYNEEEDYLFEGNYIISKKSGPIMIRFIADVIDVTSMDPMFCEGLGQRMGWAMCEAVTQAADKKQSCLAAYMLVMAEARAVNGIETGDEEPYEDEYVLVRL
jgi:hypothetical protein